MFASTTVYSAPGMTQITTTTTTFNAPVAVIQAPVVAQPAAQSNSGGFLSGLFKSLAGGLGVGLGFGLGFGLAGRGGCPPHPPCPPFGGFGPCIPMFGGGGHFAPSPRPGVFGGFHTPHGGGKPVGFCGGIRGFDVGAFGSRPIAGAHSKQNPLAHYWGCGNGGKSVFGFN